MVQKILVESLTKPMRKATDCTFGQKLKQLWSSFVLIVEQVMTYAEISDADFGLRGRPLSNS